MKQEEWFPVVNEDGQVIGQATRRDCHSGSMLLHPVVHLHVFNTQGDLYLQKRALTKDIQPGKWDTSVGGHIDRGEKEEEALYREAKEELGIGGFVPEFCYRYVWECPIERELVYVYKTISDGWIVPDKSELDEGRFWTFPEIEKNTGKDIFTPNFEKEFSLLKSWLKDKSE